MALVAGLVAALGFVVGGAVGAFGSVPAVAPTPPSGRATVVDHTTVADFLQLTARDISAAASLRVLFIDHSVGANISEGLDCMAFPSLEAAPSRCKRFEHVVPALSADPAWFRFGAEYDRSRWTYERGGSSYWREWPAYVESLVAGQDWDVVIPMPSYLVAPNGGWQPLEALEAAHPEIIFVYATSSLPRGAAGGTASDQVMERFNADGRAYARAHGKVLLDVADILSHDYQGQPCFDTRDGVEYCQTPTRCENLPDDGFDIPAICQHYTTELHGGHLGSVSGGRLRMAQAMWLLMARLASGGGVPTTSPTATTSPTVQPTVVSPTSPPTADSTPSASATPATTPEPTQPPVPPPCYLPLVRGGALVLCHGNILGFGHRCLRQGRPR